MSTSGPHSSGMAKDRLQPTVAGYSWITASPKRSLVFVKPDTQRPFH